MYTVVTYYRASKYVVIRVNVFKGARVIGNEKQTKKNTKIRNGNEKAKRGSVKFAIEPSYQPHTRFFVLIITIVSFLTNKCGKSFYIEIFGHHHQHGHPAADKITGSRRF